MKNKNTFLLQWFNNNNMYQFHLLILFFLNQNELLHIFYQWLNCLMSLVARRCGLFEFRILVGYCFLQAGPVEKIKRNVQNSNSTRPNRWATKDNSKVSNKHVFSLDRNLTFSTFVFQEIIQFIGRKIFNHPLWQGTEEIYGPTTPFSVKIDFRSFLPSLYNWSFALDPFSNVKKIVLGHCEKCFT